MGGGRVCGKRKSKRLQNGASVAGVRIVSNATGERFLKRWLVGPGGEHPRHELVPNLDGQTVGLEESFDVDGYPAEYPGDPNLPPDESISCRCTVVFQEAAPLSVEVEITPLDARSPARGGASSWCV